MDDDGVGAEHGVGERVGVMTRPVYRGTTALLSMVLAASVITACGGPAPKKTTWVPVQRGSVVTKVSASGALSTVKSQNLGFAKGDKLIELRVRVGDTVKPGQVLAKIDPFTAQQSLRTAHASLDSAQKNLDLTLHGRTVEDGQRFYSDSQSYLDALARSREAAVAAARTTAHRAWLTYVYYHKKFRAAQLALARCAGVRPPKDSDPKATHDNAVPDFPTTSSSSSTTSSSTTSTSSASTSSTSTSTSSSSSDSDSDSSSGTSASVSASTSPSASVSVSTSADCSDQESTLESTYLSDTQYKTTYVTDKRAIDTAYASANVSYWLGKFYYQGTARSTRDSARLTVPGQVATQLAAVRTAEVQVGTAQRDLSNTVLVAPVAGTVSAINGTVGEYVGTGSGTSALAPGTDAPIPGVGAAATSDQSGNASSGISATKPGGSAFIVLNNLKTFQVVVPLEESDAAKVRPNQTAQVTFDSVPGLQRDGTVLSIAPNGVNISGVTNYYATVLLAGTDPALKAGMTAEAAVKTNEIDNVLTVPNVSVFPQNGKSMVKIPGPHGQPELKEFEPGVVGSDDTQALSGLAEGQQVLRP